MAHELRLWFGRDVFASIWSSHKCHEVEFLDEKKKNVLHENDNKLKINFENTIFLTIVPKVMLVMNFKLWRYYYCTRFNNYKNMYTSWWWRWGLFKKQFLLTKSFWFLQFSTNIKKKFNTTINRDIEFLCIRKYFRFAIYLFIHSGFGCTIITIFFVFPFMKIKWRRCTFFYFPLTEWKSTKGDIR